MMPVGSSQLKSIVLCFLLAAGALWAGNTEETVKDAEKAWAAAVVAKNYAVLDRIYADRLIYAHSTGAIETKQQYIERLRSGAQLYDRITHEETRVVMYGDSAVAHSLLRMTGTSNGRPFNDHVMALHLWVKQGGNWRLAAHQTTKLAQ